MMTWKTKNPVLAGTGLVDCSARRLNVVEYNRSTPEFHYELRVYRLRLRFGMPAFRASLIASHAHGGDHG